MMQDMSQNREGADFKARKGSASHIMDKTDKLYHRKDQTKIKMDEFAIDVEFKYGLPLLILDVIEAFTGKDLSQEIKREVSPARIISRMNPDDETFMNFKMNLTDDAQDISFLIFNHLSDLDLKKIQLELNWKQHLDSMKHLDETTRERESKDPVILQKLQ